MSKKKVKFYVVWKGRNPGIYDSWEDCKNQVFGFEGAQYRGFLSHKEAVDAFQLPFQPVTSLAVPAEKKISGVSKIIKNSISVDAACSGNPGMMEYRGVVTATGKQLFAQGPFRDGTNNIGEFLALVHALAFLKNTNRPDVTIYSDSRTAISWVKKKKANTKLEHTGFNELVFQLIHRAEQWLKEHEYTNPIIKWDTENWGEIPADFGRK